MSRRTKLIILGIFLVLLSIPGIYLFLTWEVEKPLRFRLVGKELESIIGTAESGDFVRIEVINTTATGVEMTAAGVEDGDAPPGTTFAGIIHHMDARPLPGSSASESMLSAHGHFIFFMKLEKTDNPVNQQNLRIAYGYLTRSKRRALALHDAIEPYLPKFLEGRIPLPVESYEQTLLEPAP
ncbi:hypothetical protein DES53_11574 [Roseimicrobium gellanilyticum]|uniref:Uncharacterized protein n=1 Tax=Roseimicrobium gellanilyticum TaxID=748857 RepID=A0A366H4J8_9BACT|nr:hypothetical protein [Roseimicrobium gellanilyticum]RBP36933.1 hypothetical protein DES53_11574 [Roseimicrobium gellanilyticum]